MFKKDITKGLDKYPYVIIPVLGSNNEFESNESSFFQTFDSDKILTTNFENGEFQNRELTSILGTHFHTSSSSIGMGIALCNY